MLSISVIFFREILEMSMIIGVIIAATKEVPYRNFWAAIGMLIGIIFSIIVALSINKLADAFEGEGEQLFKALIMSLASFTVGWTVIWMKSHSKKTVDKIHEIGQSIAAKKLPLYAIAIAVSTNILRELTEIILFSYGAIISNNIPKIEVIIGALIGIVSSLGLSFLFYKGLIKLPRRYFFMITSWMLILIACSMASSVADSLSAAGIIPFWSTPVWDSSWLLSEQNLLGNLLHIMVGYTEKPSGIQLVFYFTTLLIITGLMYYSDKKHSNKII